MLKIIILITCLIFPSYFDKTTTPEVIKAKIGKLITIQSTSTEEVRWWYDAESLPIDQVYIDKANKTLIFVLIKEENINILCIESKIIKHYKIIPDEKPIPIDPFVKELKIIYEKERLMDEEASEQIKSLQKLYKFASETAVFRKEINSFIDLVEILHKSLLAEIKDNNLKLIRTFIQQDLKNNYPKFDRALTEEDRKSLSIVFKKYHNSLMKITEQ